MQPINNQNIINSTEYFNIAKNIFDKENMVTKYAFLTLVKISIATHNNVYIADNPEDSSIKRGARYIGRLFFNMVDVIDTNSYLGLGISMLAPPILIAAEFNKENKKELSNTENAIIYFYLSHMASTLFCHFFCSIVKMREHLIIITKLKSIIEICDRYIRGATRYQELRNQTNELYELRTGVMNKLLNLISEFNASFNGRPNNLNIAMHEITVFISNTIESIRTRVIVLSTDLPATTAKPGEIIAYNELTLYDGDVIDPNTLSVISQVALEDIEQPVICEKQLYEYKHLVTWHTTPHSNTGATCPHNRNKLIWNKVQRVEK